MSAIRPPKSLLLAVVLVYPAVAFFPYNFHSPRVENGASPRPGGGLSFASPGVAVSAGAPAWLAEARRRDRLELRLRLRSAALEQRGPARILTLSAGPHRRNLTVGQVGDALEIRLRTAESSQNGKPGLRIPGVVQPGRWLELRLSLRPGRLQAALNGEVVVDRPLPAGALAPWDETMKLALGNEHGGARPWRGELARAALGLAPDRLTDYAAAGVLELPRPYWAFQPRLRPLPFVHGSAQDMVVNLLGFIPLGLLLALYLGVGRTAAVVLFGAALSLGLELVQLALPDRYTASGDLLLNTAGSALGLLVARVLAQRPALARTLLAPLQRLVR